MPNAPSKFWTRVVLVTLSSLITAAVSHAACAPPRSAPGGNTIWVEDLVVPANTTTATITARLSTSAAVAGGQNDLSLPATLRIHSNSNGRPDCAVNPTIDKSGSSFLFRPNDCVGDACTSMRALVFATDNLEPIADGAVLYTCNIDVTGGGEFVVTGVVLGDPDGRRIAGAAGRDGTVCIDDAPPPTPIPTASATAPNTPTNTSTRTQTPSPSTTATATPSATPSATHTPTLTRTPTTTPTPTQTATTTNTATATATATASATETPTQASLCAGDCNRDLEVTIDELILAVNIALDNAGVVQCPAADHDGNHEVTIDELVSAVGRALDGC